VVRAARQLDAPRPEEVAWEAPTLVVDTGYGPRDVDG
jgi:hypothetical protein